MAAAGWLDAAEVDAASLLHQAFEGTGLRPCLGARGDGVLVDHVNGGDDPFERMTSPEMTSWRRLHHLLREVPVAQRSQVQATACWNERPWDLPGLRAGLRALADALRRPGSRP